MTMHRKSRNPPRAKPVPVAYLDLVQALDDQRRARGLTHDELEGLASIGRRHWAHYLRPNTSAGRLASEGTLRRVARALGMLDALSMLHARPSRDHSAEAR